MSREILTAGNAPIPYEVIVLSQGEGGRMFRAVLTSKKLDTQRVGYQCNAIGIDPTTGKRISLAPTTLVELARPVVK